MADLGTILSVIELVQKAIAIYNSIEELPQQMTQLRQRMDALNTYLGEVRKYLEREASSANAGTPRRDALAGVREGLGKLMKEIKSDVEKVYDLFYRYKNGIVSQSMNLELRSAFVTRLWFSLINNSADKAEAMMKDIDEQLRLLNYYIQLIVATKVSAPTLAKRELTTTAVVKSPGSAAPRRDYKILFVDPYNEARSVVSEALIKLLGELTVKAGGDWRVDDVQSAGFFIWDKNDCIDLTSCLNYSYKSYRLPWWSGGKKPNAVALAALFDNKWCDYPFKKVIGDQAATHLSRGMTKDMFSRFDFIITFTIREHDNVIKLREAVRKETRGGLPQGKAQVVQLGSFLAPKGNVIREILHPDRISEPVKHRENWNRKVAELKTALKAFLKRELDWKQPVKDM
jgi:protein-tyrosine-phosphatase